MINHAALFTYSKFVGCPHYKLGGGLGSVSYIKAEVSYQTFILMCYQERSEHQTE